MLLLGSCLTSGCCFSSLVHLLSSDLISSHYFSSLWLLILSFSLWLYHCYIVFLLILIPYVIFPASFTTYALLPFEFLLCSCGEYLQSLFSSSLSIHRQNVFLWLFLRWYDIHKTSCVSAGTLQAAENGILGWLLCIWKYNSSRPKLDLLLEKVF